MFKKKNHSITQKSFISNEGELLKAATAAQKEGNIEEALSYIDKAIGSYSRKGELNNAFPAYKKKGTYLFKAGKRDEAWKLYNQLITIYATDYIFLPQIYNEMRKQLEKEKNFKEALDKALLSEILTRKSQIIQNAKYQNNSFDVDIKWEEDSILQKLSKKADVDWDNIKKILVQEYSKVNYQTNFIKIYEKIRAELKK